MLDLWRVELSEVTSAVICGVKTSLNDMKALYHSY